ncbi:hypothetical protein B4P00_22035 [Shewanella xiamenensis]|uniref:hypothetical protein n=1 Tax=Shewanella xiamenensis TaxID=332186 RepID=UPI0008498D45|nr:hypothetical protein [Shewanella xiamenensis]MBW0298850.1 hypothetical protein [Shewanella xiamenensis]ODR83790.1 hypothetical protein ABT47_23830 [Shewanella xiamenensis]
MKNQDITFDRYGRMNFHPEYHSKHKTPWTTVDEKYLIEKYEIIGPEEMSFTLERTIHTIMTRVYQLRKKGVMKPVKPIGQRKTHKRISANQLHSEVADESR